jgi:hypothetical protein
METLHPTTVVPSVVHKCKTWVSHIKGAAKAKCVRVRETDNSSFERVGEFKYLGKTIFYSGRN